MAPGFAGRMTVKIGSLIGGLAILGMLVLPVMGQDLAETEAAKAECDALVEAAPDNWIGWRRDFGNGYTDSFEFHDGRFDNRPSVLKTGGVIDAIALEETSWCYRGDGSLALIAVTMSSPDYAQGGDMGPLISREGRIYVGADGHVLRIAGWLTDGDGVKLGPLQMDTHQLARDCGPVDLRLRADDAEGEYLSVLGDIEGNHPEYTANELDWCAVAEEGP